MMIAGSANLSAFMRGDTWGGIPSITITPTTGQTLASARMMWRDTTGACVLSLTTSDGSMTITDAGPDSWILAVPAMKPDVPAGVFLFDLECTDSAGTVKTYWRGNIEAQQDQTY